MTGIERLRGYARRMDELGVWPGGAKLLGIADQIEREARDGEHRRIELCAVLGVDSDTGWSDAVEMMRRRLMPEGMEWPRHESGEPVSIGDEFIDHEGLLRKVERIVLMGDGYSLVSRTGTYYLRRYGERVKRPAVLAADGEPLEVGQTVWHVATGAEYTVRDVTSGGAHLSKGDRPGGYCRAEYLTHQRPVLDADGVPIREGDTVYDTSDGTELVITSAELDVLDHVKASQEKPIKASVSIHPLRLTHTKPEPPDSWGRIERDALCFVEDNAGIPHDQDQMERDMLAILRRCRALAERGQ